MAILRKKVQILHVQLSQEILEFLAQRVRTNVRRLEGALMRVASFVSLSGREISRETVEQLLRDILQEEAKKIVTIDQIQKKVAEHFDVRLADMTSKRRPENIAFPRQIAMFLARQLTESSLNIIGEAFGGRDHGTENGGFKPPAGGPSARAEAERPRPPGPSRTPGHPARPGSRVRS